MLVYWGSMTQLTRKLPIALRLVFKGFPRTDGLMSPLKDTKANLLLNFWGRAERALCIVVKLNFVCKNS